MFLKFLILDPPFFIASSRIFLELISIFLHSSFVKYFPFLKGLITEVYTYLSIEAAYGFCMIL